jgi:hypothetical protein
MGMREVHEAVAPLLTEFTGRLADVVSPVAVWAHGSLALGDFRPGISDLDLIAVVGAAADDAQQDALTHLHRSLEARFPLAEKLHCSYLARDALADTRARHVTWAHRRLFARPVTEVTRRELHSGGLVLLGPPPGGLLPPVSDAELAAFVRADLRDFWLPATAAPLRWLQDVWVDLGMLTLARATVTLADGRLLTKGQALDTLTAMNAPPSVVADIRARRYATPLPLTLPARLHRAHTTRRYLRRTLKSTLSAPS